LRIKVENQGGQPNIGFWDDAQEWAEWRVKFSKAGEYEVRVAAATVHNGASVAIEFQGQKLIANVPVTGDWAKFQEISAGKIDVKQPGEYVLKAAPVDKSSWKAINLRRIRLEKPRN
jgi:hypothetical protein